MTSTASTGRRCSPRGSCDVSGLPSQAQTWVNQHITYTHGYGVAVSAVNQIASGGAPDFLVQDVPMISSAPTLTITQPRIYYGLLGTNYVLVDTKDKEFDYPGPSGDVYTSYTGTGGIPIGSFLNRLAFMARFTDIRFFTSSAITSGSKVILYDNIMARLKAAAPFLTFDSDPYMVIANGKLYWIADAYTTTNLLPYSQPSDGINYIRNSVKVVIDAYNGSMTFYVFDPKDPLIRTYEKIFPGMFKPESDMPASLRAHVRYPQDYFRVQAAALRHLSRDRPRCALQQRQPVGDPQQRVDLGIIPGECLLHDHASPGPDQRGVRADHPVHAQRPPQHDRLAGGALGSAQLRQGGQLQVPLQPDGLRAGAGRGGRQPEPDHLGPADALGPAGLDGDLRQPADDPGRELAALRAAPLFAVGDDAATSNPAGHRLLPLAVIHSQLTYRASSRMWSWNRRSAPP